jgi:protein-S-isoprenylcysteine O-methyltransferase Ste14
MNNSVFKDHAASDTDACSGKASALETKIPPPIVAALICAAMGWLSLVTPSLPMPMIARLAAALAIALVGGMVAIWAGVRFRRAKTTINPVKPQTASSLVTTGIFGYTRNPMYVGLLFLVLAWAMLLSSPIALAGPVAFVLYIGRFQIAPEERALSGLFGAEYAAYQARVRRWL